MGGRDRGVSAVRSTCRGTRPAAASNGTREEIGRQDRAHGGQRRPLLTSVPLGGDGRLASLA
jgi:hypothetical protein